MALGPEDLAKAEELLNELPGIKAAIDGADSLSNDQLEGLIHLVEAASTAMNEPEGSARQTEIVNGLMEINDAITSKIQEAQEGKE